jgi:hypothetical protein
MLQTLAVLVDLARLDQLPEFLVYPNEHHQAESPIRTQSAEPLVLVVVVAAPMDQVA